MYVRDPGRPVHHAAGVNSDILSAVALLTPVLAFCIAVSILMLSKKR